MIVLAIDPGPTQSAWVVWDGTTILSKGLETNETVRRMLHCDVLYKPDHLVIEQIRSYGMAVGATIFDTIFWAGRFAEAWITTSGLDFSELPRWKAKQALCHDMRAKDANIRQALVDRIGPAGTKKDPGPTYGVKKDMWAALAVAVAWLDGARI